MYKIKRFGITSKSEISDKAGKGGKWGLNNKRSFLPKGVVPIPSGVEKVEPYNYEWPNVDQYNIIIDNNKNFVENYKWIQRQSSKGQLYERSLLLRINQLLKDMRGNNSGDIHQYVTSDSPHSNIQDKTHMLASLNGIDTLVYSKDIDSEHRLVYEIRRPNKKGNKNISDVVIDDINDHTYKSISYNPERTTNRSTGETIVEDKPDFKGRHKTRKYNEDNKD